MTIPSLDIPVTLAAGTAPVFLTDTVALIVAGALIAYICSRLNLVPIVGFLLAGVLIGPKALGLVRDEALVAATAEIGVILLLFTIGIEFSLEKLASIKRLIFGGGIAQVGLSIIVTAVVLVAFGVDWNAAIFTGMLVALSSTAIVLKLLADTGETNSERGQVGLGLLIFQDLAIVLMVLIVASLGGGGGWGEMLWAMAKAVLIIVVVLVVARRVMPRILEHVAKTCSPELFLLTVIAICFGTAYLTSLAGVSLSLGAFLAGLMVSESRFSQHALSETLPLQILFSATFFISVGMLLDVGFLVRNLPIVFGAIAVVLAIKVATTWISVKALGYTVPVATASALMLAQIGEFSFVLERAGREVGLLPAGAGEAGSQTFIAATVVLMVLTPFLMRVGSGLSTKMVARREVAGLSDGDTASLGEPHDLEDHVIVAGYGQAARGLVRVLSGSGIPFIITTLNPDGANEAEAEGMKVVRGDSTKPFLLQHVGITNAKMMVIADDNPAMAHRIVSVARQLNPTMRIVVRTRYTQEVDSLAHAGADTVIAEELESIVQLFGEVLRDYRIPPAEIEAYEDLARRDGYSALFDDEVDTSVFRCSPGEDCFDSRTVTVRAGSAVVGRSLESLMRIENFDLKVISINRDGQEIVDPSADLVLESGDELVLSGPTQSFAKNAALFRTSGGNGSSSTGATVPGDKARARTGSWSNSSGAGAETRVGSALYKSGTSASNSSGTVTTAGDRSTSTRMPVPVPAMGGDDNARAFLSQTGLTLDARVTYAPIVDESVCTHLDRINPVFPSAPGCEDCLRQNTKWVHLRLCLTCGHVGCCDTSDYKHATAHFHETEHPVMKSIELHDDWAWCFVDEEYI